MSSKSEKADQRTQQTLSPESSILNLNELGSSDDRSNGEHSAFLTPRRWRRKSPRVVTVYLRTTPETKKRLNDLADAENKSLGEVIEELVDARYQAMKSHSG